MEWWADDIISFYTVDSFAHIAEHAWMKSNISHLSWQNIFTNSFAINDMGNDKDREAVSTGTQNHCSGWAHGDMMVVQRITDDKAKQ